MMWRRRVACGLALLGSPRAGAWTTLPSGFQGFHGHLVRSWTLAPHVGVGRCFGVCKKQVVVGTSRGAAVVLPLEGGGSLGCRFTELAASGDGLLGVDAQGTYVGGYFFDSARAAYVASVHDLADPRCRYHTVHRTFIVGGGFTRALYEQCYFSLAIDGAFVAQSARSGRETCLGNVHHLLRAHHAHPTAASMPTCCSVSDCGVVAIGFLDGHIVLLDLDTRRVVAHVPAAPAAASFPRAVHLSRNADQNFALAWTTDDGCVGMADAPFETLKRQFTRTPALMTVRRLDPIADQPLTAIHAHDDDGWTAEAEDGTRLLKHARRIWRLPPDRTAPDWIRLNHRGTCFMSRGRDVTVWRLRPGYGAGGR